MGDVDGWFIWDVTYGECLVHMTGFFASCISVFPDGTRLITGGKDKIARVWSLQGWRAAVEEQVLDHEGTVYSCAVASDGLSVFTACADEAARLWDLSKHST